MKNKVKAAETALNNEKKNTVNIDIKQFGMVIALVAIFLIFFAFTGGKNASPTNINNLIMQNGYVVILAVGMLLCVLTGNVDLGVGSIVALTGATSAMLVCNAHMPVFVGFAVALLVGAASGAFVGFFISELHIPPFVVTLATMLMGRGLTYTMLKAKTVGPTPASYNFIGAGFFPTIKVPFFANAAQIDQLNAAKAAMAATKGTESFAAAKDAYTSLLIKMPHIDLVAIIIGLIATALIIFAELKSIKTKKKYDFPVNPLWQTILKEVVIIAIMWFVIYKLARNNGIPMVLVLLTVVVGIYHFITSKTVAGRQVYALGGNEKAARLSGINTKKVFFWVYTNMGLLSALAGIVLSARNGSATPKAGDGFELDAIASCYIGGAAAAGGVGTIMGAVVGAFVMGVLNNGMSLIGWSTDIQKIAKGAVLLGAVIFDMVSKRKKN